VEQIIITGLTIKQLKQILADTIRETNEQKGMTLKQSPLPIKEAQFISRKETAILLHISLPTLNDLTKDGILKSYRIGTRVLYKPEEVSEAVLQRNFTDIKRKNKQS
jgi:excisionase family DNA binding protein